VYICIHALTCIYACAENYRDLTGNFGVFKNATVQGAEHLLTSEGLFFAPQVSDVSLSLPNSFFPLSRTHFFPLFLSPNASRPLPLSPLPNPPLPPSFLLASSPSPSPPLSPSPSPSPSFSASVWYSCSLAGALDGSCSVLQFVAVWCIVLQCVAVDCRHSRWFWLTFCT